MYYYGNISQKPTCLYRGKDKNFIIVETKKENNTSMYELLINPLSKEDALDICIQEDSSIAKMMLEIQLYEKLGKKENTTGKEKEILLALGKTKEAKTAITLLKKINKATTKEYFDDNTNPNEQQDILEELNLALKKGNPVEYLRE